MTTQRRGRSCAAHRFWCTWLIVAAIGCGSAATTSVRLELSYDAAWGLDQLDVRVGDRVTSTTAAREVVVLLPEAWVGDELAIVVIGLRGGERYAAGRVAMVPQ